MLAGLAFDLLTHCSRCSSRLEMRAVLTRRCGVTISVSLMRHCADNQTCWCGITLCRIDSTIGRYFVTFLCIDSRLWENPNIQLSSGCLWHYVFRTEYIVGDLKQRDYLNLWRSIWALLKCFSWKNLGRLLISHETHTVNLVVLVVVPVQDEISLV